VRLENKNIFPYFLKTHLPMYYNPGDVVVNSEVVGLSPGNLDTIRPEYMYVCQYSNKFGDTFSQMEKFRPIWSHCLDRTPTDLSLTDANLSTKNGRHGVTA
jgi:hypothetical protein